MVSLSIGGSSEDSLSYPFFYSKTLRVGLLSDSCSRSVLKSHQQTQYVCQPEMRAVLATSVVNGKSRGRTIYISPKT